jgi:hypothetical protein
MSKYFILSFIFFATYFFSCKKNETNDTEEANPINLEIPNSVCEPQVFSKKLKKTISTNLELVPTIKEISYFYDNQNRVDSITESSFYTLILYDASGKVAKTVRKSNLDNHTYFEDIHNYENDVLKTIIHQGSFVNGTPSYSIVKNFEWSDNNYLKKSWFETANDKTIYSVDSCGNVLKEQDFYNVDNREHRLVFRKFATTFSPYFLIGLNDAFPDQYYKHNIIYFQLAKWDCADYDSTPVKTTYEYNSEGLPTKSTNRFGIVEFFYE